MSIKKVVIQQLRQKTNQARQAMDELPAFPPIGWLRTVRKALGMTGSQLASRMDVTKAWISTVERSEAYGGLNLKTMQKMAQGMGCRFVYAVVPEEDVESLLRKRALMLVKRRVRNASVHMALEDQSLSDKQLDFEIERLVEEMMGKLPRDFWDKK